MTSQVYPSTSHHQNHHQNHHGGTPSPSYSSLPAADGMNPFSSIHRLSEDSSTVDANSDIRSITSAPPPYNTPFTPTYALQIETLGKSVLSLPLPPRADPIPIFSLTNPITPQFVSLRPSRRSGSCFLVSPSPDQTDQEEHIPLSITVYRCGPGRHPRIRLFKPGTLTPTSNPFISGPSNSNPGGVEVGDDQDGMDMSVYDAFELLPVGLFTRAITFRTRLGTFEWRYAGRKERRGMGVDSGSVLVFERVVRVAVSGGKEEVLRTGVARLVRSEETRAVGSSPSSAGNGGRLLVDLGVWDEAAKMEREMALVMVVTTCLAMLKKEIDRRRAQQMAVMMGAAGGGP